MKRVFGSCRDIAPGTRPIVTIGMFDGVHLGHQDVINATLKTACERGEPAVAVTFDVHPRRILAPETAPPTITSLEHRLVLFERLELDATVVLPFSKELANTTAAEFVDSILVRCLHAGGLVLGHDAHLGKEQEGSTDYLRRVGEANGFSVKVVEPRKLDNTVVSSTAIRNAVTNGELATAESMLGRPVSVLGTVIEGMGLARALGFPTLNLDPHHELRPPTGVYLSHTRCGDTCWNSITNIGHKPTVRPRTDNDVLVESHLLNYAGNLYGQTVEVQFIKRLRNEQRFESHDELAAQVCQDIAEARSFFTRL